MDEKLEMESNDKMVWHAAALKYKEAGLTDNQIVDAIMENEHIKVRYSQVHSYLFRIAHPEQFTYRFKENRKAYNKEHETFGKLETGSRERFANENKERKKKEKEELQRQRAAFMHENYISEEKDVAWDGELEIKFGLIGDTHIGSKYTQYSHLHEFYNVCAERGVTEVYHAGDICEGLKMRPGHEYELYEITADELVTDVINNYPRRKGIKTFFITGNHDASIYKQVGYDVGKAIDIQRDDMEYLGKDCAVVKLTPKCKLELRHPWDGTAYALSYKVQKMVESMDPGTKPNILAVGHYHKASYFFHRNVHIFQTGCFQGQTPFTRGKGLSVNMGGWIVTVKVDENGTIKSIIPEYIPFYEAIEEDYKSYWNH